MPIDYPSQAQTGIAKGLEGLFKGIQGGMEGQEKNAYMMALQRMKEHDPNKTVTMKYQGLAGKGGSGPKFGPDMNMEDLIKQSVFAGARAIGLSPNDNFSPLDLGALSQEEAQKFNEGFRSVYTPGVAAYNQRLWQFPQAPRMASDVGDYLELQEQVREPGMLDTLRGKLGLSVSPSTYFTPRINTEFYKGRKRKAAAPGGNAAPGGSPKGKAGARLDNLGL